MPTLNKNKGKLGFEYPLDYAANFHVKFPNVPNRLP